MPDELTPSERALAPHRWRDDENENAIPPTTPLHPKEPVGSEEVPAGAEGPDTPPHVHKFPQWVTGWCVHAWIIRTPEAGLAPLTERARLAQPHGGGAMQVPGPSLVARVVELLRAVNDIYWPQCGIAFQLCAVHVLDASKVTYVDAGAPKKLSEFFDPAGQLIVGRNRPDVGAALRMAEKQNSPADFADAMRKRCINLFFVHDVEHADDPGMEEGVGAPIPFGDRDVPVVFVDAASTALAQTIAHEIGHGLDHQGHSNAPQNLMRATVGPGDTRLEPEQRAGFLAFLAKHVDPACP